jgi:hypothetical protein
MASTTLPTRSGGSVRGFVVAIRTVATQSVIVTSGNPDESPLDCPDAFETTVLSVFTPPRKISGGTHRATRQMSRSHRFDEEFDQPRLCPLIALAGFVQT